MYEVFALKYGERDTTKCQFFYRESSHDKLTLDYFVWLILGGPQPLLVDTGFRDDDARARGIRNYVSPAAMVERAGGQARRHPDLAHHAPPLRPLGRPQPVPERRILDPGRGSRVLDRPVRPAAGLPRIGQRRGAGAPDDVELRQQDPDRRG